MEKHVYLIRHGESEENADHVARGQHVALTLSGRAQAQAVAERVARLDVAALVASPFTRAQETASAISKRTGLAIEHNDLFREWGQPTSFIGKHEEDPEIVQAAKAILNKTDPDYRHLDEETFSELRLRAEQALKFLQSHAAERVCVVTHYGFLHMLATVIVFGQQAAPWMTARLFYHLRHENTGLTYIRHTPDRTGAAYWHLVTWNDQTHLG